MEHFELTVGAIVGRWPHLRKVGQEWQGPCPSCGGVDRFHLKTDSRGKPIFGCRKCLDGLSADARRDSFERILTSLGLWQKTHEKPAKRPSVPARATKGRTQPVEHPDRAKWLERIWIEAVLPPGTPGMNYLVRRCCLPPGLLPYNPRPDLPRDVRWLASSRFGDLDALRPASTRWGWPRGTAGVLVVAYRQPSTGKLVAISFEALLGNGKRPDNRWRRSLGPRGKGEFMPWMGPGGTVICEGECDAISLGWKYPDSRIIATGGTSQMRNWHPLPQHPEPFIIESDDGEKGIEASRKLLANLYRKGRYADLVFQNRGEDPAAEWRNRIMGRKAKEGRSLLEAWEEMLDA